MRTVPSFIGTLVLAAASAVAADAPAGGTTNPDTRKRAAPPAEDPIAAAQRDLAAIKDAKSGLDQRPKSDLGLGGFSSAEFSGGTQAPWVPAAPKSPAEATAAKKSANWLVDAMMKKPSTRGVGVEGKGRSDEKSNSGPRDKDGNALTLTGEDADALAFGKTLGQRDNGPDRVQMTRNDQARAGSLTSLGASTEPVVNPLTTFMATWMTLQDYKLLQPGLMGNASTDFGRGAGGGAPLGAQVAASDASIANLGRSPVAQSSAAPRENPFLQDFAATGATGSAPAKAAGPVLPAAVVAAPPPMVFTPPPEAVPQKPITPAFVKPNDDAKYFKPLKRF